MYKIDTDIPLPTGKVPEGKTATIRQLEVGQSAFFPGDMNLSGIIRNVKSGKDCAEREFTIAKREEEVPNPQYAPDQATEVDATPIPATLKMKGSRVWRTK